MFVLEIRPDSREVVVGTRDELFQDEVVVGGLNWLLDAPSEGARLRAQLRHRAPAVEALVDPGEAGSDVLTLRLVEPQPAVTPGQSAVLFDGDRVVGGGRIVRAGAVAVPA
jgi:tRNA-specific 2-thiouridylase